MSDGSIEKVLKMLGIEVAIDYPNRLWAKCPYHDDKDPSWSIMTLGAKRGLQYCQSCKQGGSLADLVMHVRGVSFPGAMTWLREVGADTAERDPVHAVRFEIANRARRFQLPAEVSFEPLVSWSETARRYIEQRHITRRQVERWGIGYAVYGRLAGRIVLVTRDEYGVPTNYTGRTFIGDPKRYLNASGEENPDLSVLFGEHYWPVLEERDVIVLTEGAINALAVERAVGEEVALGALNGANVNPLHFASIGSFGHVIVLTDPDPTGDKVAKEIATALARTETRCTRVRLAEKTDADSIGAEELRGRLWPLCNNPTRT